eukprot:TRINITY_DN2879_c0_g2_i6.p1 TRINITY_DN2879_c0_g2~~TRINITY_DN2879_c0_g2_i6.p1  ORF type:complete len:467 (+),score=38.71 TRINITY_DN2879_c0_g2_i6:615-2015(+)
MCTDRTYTYYLPAWVLGFKSDGSQQDMDRKQYLDSILALFVGLKPFHNYTKRALYKKTVKLAYNPRDKFNQRQDKGLKNQQQLESDESKKFSFAQFLFVFVNWFNKGFVISRNSLTSIWNKFYQSFQSMLSSVFGIKNNQLQNQQEQILNMYVNEKQCKEGQNQKSKIKQKSKQELEYEYKNQNGQQQGYSEQQKLQRRYHADAQVLDAVLQEQKKCIFRIEGGAIGMRSHNNAIVYGSSSNQYMLESDSDEENPYNYSRAWYMKDALKYNVDKDEKDMIERSHYRKIISFSAQGPYQLTQDGVGCIKLVIRGNSFMFHQIRKMVGMVVAVMQGMYSLDFLRASLTAPSRAILPLAPPETLVLESTTFAKFTNTESDPTKIEKWTGEQLQLNTLGQTMQQHFQHQVLSSVVDQMLKSDLWQRWVEWLQVFEYPEEEKDKFVKGYEQFVEWKQSKAPYNKQPKTIQQ